MKKFWLGLIAFSLMAPAWAIAGGYASPSSDQLLQRLDQLTRELESVKAELNRVKSQQGELAEKQEDLADTVDENADGIEEINTNGVNRFQVFGDYRFRLDSTRLDTNGYTTRTGGTQRGERITNDTLYTNRLRLGMKVKATDNITFKGRLTMYKIWGMETANKTSSGLFPANSFSYDPNMSRRPQDNTLRVEMAYVNWVNVFDLPMWISVGRRPTVDGPPAQLRYNYDSRYATPTALGVDWTFDGATLGWAGDELYFPGAKFRICYGRGYESGLDYTGNTSGDLSDTDLYGFSWDIINDKEAHRFANLQFFRAANIPNMMEGIQYPMADPYDPMGTGDQRYTDAAMDDITYVDASDEIGDIYHASFVYMDEFRGVNWFVSGGLSRTDDRDTNGGVHQSYGLLTNPGETKQNHWGWAAYVGARVPVEMLSSKIGFEYNYGSRYWINFTPAADDVYSSKLATRGHVAEVYWIWDIPENPLSKYAKAFIRAGYQYYWFNYTGSGNWMGRPVDVDDVDMTDSRSADYTTAFGGAPVEHMDNLYLTFEVYF